MNLKIILHRFIERSVEIERAIVDLMEFVKVGDPFTASLTEQQLESFLYVLIPQIGSFANIDNSTISKIFKIVS